MFFFRYKGPGTFKQIGSGKYYSQPWFKEQMPDGTYQRPLSFFFGNRIDLACKSDIELVGIPGKEMHVCYVGHGNTQEAVMINGVVFHRGVWQTVPLNFESRDNKGDDMFNTLGFRFSIPGTVKSDISELVTDECRILIYRKFGGLGDILMQSLLFPELRRRLPRAHITFAIPKLYMPIFEHCGDIDEIEDVANVQERIYRIVASGEYDLISDISTSCAAYEVKSLQTKGFVDKERSDIWAATFGLTLNEHKSCLRFTIDEMEEGRRMFRNNDVYERWIGLCPVSSGPHRGYTYAQALIDGLNDKGYKVLVIHHERLPLENCRQLPGLSMRQLGAVISNIDAMVSVDTGPLHYAGVLGIPLIGLFGITDSKVRLSYYNATGLQGQCRKNQNPCWYVGSGDCLNGPNSSCMDIPVDSIVSAVERMLCRPSESKQSMMYASM